MAFRQRRTGHGQQISAHGDWRGDGSDAADATISSRHRQHKQADRTQGELMNGMSKQGELIKTMAEHCPAIG